MQSPLVRRCTYRVFCLQVTTVLWVSFSLPVAFFGFPSKLLVIYSYPNFAALIFFLVLPRFAWYSRCWMEIFGLNSSRCWNKIWLTRASEFFDFNGWVVVFLRRNCSCSFAIISIFVGIGSLFKKVSVKFISLGKNGDFLLIRHVIYKTSFVYDHIKSLMGTTIPSVLT